MITTIQPLKKRADDVMGKFEVFSGDVRDPHGVKEAMKDCDVVLHSPDTYVDNTIEVAHKINH